MKSAFLISLFILSAFGMPMTTHAQPASIGGLELSASSANPVPGQNVTLTAKSYTLDINSARIVWTVNGKVEKDAIGGTTLDVVAPALGKKLDITVTAAMAGAQTVGSSLTIGSGSVDLILETDGYVPPLFKGKITPVHQNTVRIIAIGHLAGADGVEYDPKTLVYQWKRNDRVIEDQSGYGKQVLSLPGEIVPRPYTITVSVWPRDTSSRAQALMQVSSNVPTISLYVNDPLYGPLLNRTIENVVRIGTQRETTILAAPFGFNISEANAGIGSPGWLWSINGSRRSELSDNQSIVLRAPTGSTGSSNVRLDIRGTDNILQGASAGFTATFSAGNAQQAESEVVF